MSARNHYDEDFKRTPSLNFTTTVKLNPRSLKSMGYSHQHSRNGLSSIQPLKQTVEKSLQPNKSKNFRSVWLSLRKKIKY